jgi:hypothetical protein
MELSLILVQHHLLRAKLLMDPGGVVHLAGGAVPMVGGAVPVVNEAVNMTDGAVPVADGTDGAVPVADEPERTGGGAVLMACGAVAVAC